VNQRVIDKCVKAVTPSLGPGEQVEGVEVALIGKVSAKKKAAVAAAVGIATAGHLIVAVKPRAYFLVFTSKRLILVENNRGLVGKVVGDCARQAITSGPLNGHLLTLSADVTLDGAAYRFSWGRLAPGQARSAMAALTGANS
jgi:hypothetical protein